VQTWPWLFVCLPFVGGQNSFFGVEVQALQQRRALPWRRVLLVLAALIVLALVGSTLGIFFWLRGYQPLAQGGRWGSNPSDGVMVEPPIGSGGTSVFFPRYRENGTFRVMASVANRSRFTVTVLGTPKPPHRTEVDPFPLESYPVLVKAEVTPPKRPSYYGSPLDAAHPIRIEPGAERDIIFVYKFNWRCIGGQPPRYWKTGAPLNYVSLAPTVPLRVKYARWFEKTQNVPTRFAITLSCKKNWSAPSP
jgi:hypothetical protein